MKNYKSSSRRKTPWDFKGENIDPLESFIKDKYLNQYAYKHPALDATNEAALLNSYELTNCKRCESKDIKHYGHDSNGVNRYYCHSCRRTFTITTNTIFDHHKLPISEWIEFALEMLSFESINHTSINNRNALNTTIYWLDKTLLLFEHYQDNVVLSDTVWIDEKLYRLRNDQLKRKADGTFYRGHSINQICIGVGCDIHGKVLFIVEGTGKTSINKTIKTFKDHIQVGSTIIHDDEKAHNELVRELNLNSISYNSKDLKKLDDKENPLEPVNRQCYYIERFLNSHSGFDRKNTQGFLNLLAFIQGNRKLSKLDLVKKLLDMALCTKIKLKYRDER